MTRTFASAHCLRPNSVQYCITIARKVRACIIPSGHTTASRKCHDLTGIAAYCQLLPLVWGTIEGMLTACAYIPSHRVFWNSRSLF